MQYIRRFIAVLVISLPFAPSVFAGAVVIGPVDSSLLYRPKVTPGQLATFVVAGLSVEANQAMTAASLPLPNTLAGISARITRGSDPPMPVPLLQLAFADSCSDSLYPNLACSQFLEVTLEIPTESKASDPGGDGLPAIDSLVISDQSGNTASVVIEVVASVIRVLTSCVPGFNICHPAVTKADGSSPWNSPVHGGDVLVAYVQGLGKTDPLIPSGFAAPVRPLAQLVFPVVLNFDFHPNAGPIRPPKFPYGFMLDGYANPLFAGATPGFIGLYQVNLQVPPVPPGTPGCGGNIGSNLTVTILNRASQDGFSICVQ